VLAFSDDRRASKKFVNDLTARLEKAPKNVVASVENRIDREIQYFTDRRALFVNAEDLLKVRNFVRDRIDYERSLYNPLNIFSEQEIPEPMLDFMGMQRKYTTQISDFSRLPGGYYATPDEKVRLVVAYMPGKGLDGAKAIREAIVKEVRALDPKRYAPDLEIKYTGNIENMIEESDALVADLVLSTVIVIVLVAVAMLLFYRSILATAALNLSVLMGTFWTFGVSYFAVGYLNANSAFLGSIVLGNGINFGIMYLARYLEERRRAVGHDEAIELAMSGTATSTLTAALAAGLSYGSLMLTTFRGFNQFGKIGLIGMVLCWLAAYTLLPAFLTILARQKLFKWDPSQTHPKPFLTGFIARGVEKFPLPISLVSVAGILISLSLLPKIRGGIIETDLSRLRDKESMTHGAGALYHYIDDVFKHSVSPTVILPRKRENAPKIADYLRKKKVEQAGDPVLSTIQTLDDFIPKDQSKKIQILKEIQRLLPPRILSRLPAEERAQAQSLLNPKALHPIQITDLPPLILNRFREKDGSLGKIVLVDKQFSPNGTDDANMLVRFVDTTRGAADTVEPGAPVAGGLAISYDMFTSIVHDGPRATLVAFLSVLVLVFILFRRLGISLQTLAALLIGVTWMAGIILGLGLKINFLNFIALPITFGIGVDYGVNVFQRYRESGPGRIMEVVRNTGGAVLLSSFTTMIGYSSLLIAGNQAFVSFGRLAVIGELACVSAAVVTFPAFLILAARLRRG
ncbi:MAG: efflux RND transporter permease subunit, partial [Bdellovibrionota bacterium]